MSIFGHLAKTMHQTALPTWHTPDVHIWHASKTLVILVVLSIWCPYLGIWPRLCVRPLSLPDKHPASKTGPKGALSTWVQWWRCAPQKSRSSAAFSVSLTSPSSKQQSYFSQAAGKEKECRNLRSMLSTGRTTWKGWRTGSDPCPEILLFSSRCFNAFLSPLSAYLVTL